MDVTECKLNEYGFLKKKSVSHSLGLIVYCPFEGCKSLLLSPSRQPMNYVTFLSLSLSVTAVEKSSTIIVLWNTTRPQAPSAPTSGTWSVEPFAPRLT